MYLCTEKENGLLIKLSPDDIVQLLKPKEGRLNVDACFINVNHGEKIARAFVELGVLQVFTFERDESQKEDL